MLAIDPGTRNFAWCVVDTLCWRDPVQWQVRNICAGNKRTMPTEDEARTAVANWVALFGASFAHVDAVVIERQMREPFKTIVTAIHTWFYSKRPTVVHPMTVASVFNLPKQRVAKKAATVALVQRYATIPPRLNDKLDDLADAWLLGVWALIELGGISKLEIH